MATYFLGIDGGATKTEFALIKSDGSVLKTLLKAGCNPNDIGYDNLLALIVDGIQTMQDEVGPIYAFFGGIAGISSGNHAARLIEDLRRLYPDMLFDIKNDSFNLFAMDEEAHMTVISGTGCVVYAKSGEEYHRIGGWGYLLDCAGSAYDIGREVLRQALYEEDMHLEKSIMSQLLCQKEETEIVWNLIHKIYKEGRPYIASLAPLAFEAYKMGDEGAKTIIEQNTKALAEHLNAGVLLYNANPVAIASGGLFEHYPDIMIQNINKYTDVEIRMIDLPPIYGACRRACRMANVTMTNEFYQNFKNTYGR